MAENPVDQQAFAALVRDNERALARIARHYAAPQERDDLLQEILLQLWRSRDGYDGRARQSTWVYRVALNTALSHKRKPRAVHEPLEAAPERSDAHAADALLALERFLAGLDPVQRAVLLLDLEGLGRDEVAEVLGLTANAVAIRLTRLRQAFEAQLAEDA
ncbi:MAG TPA: RNA polymerase sigma factor [Xanthomonadales bacterium]|nr:RNA polymerase sigma factor [Xanthomonadales bacterium]